MTRIHTYSAEGQRVLTHPDVPPNTRLSELVTLKVGELAYRVGDEVELDIEMTVEESFGAESGHVITHSCHTVGVTVSYAGADRLVTVKPSARIKQVLKKAIAAFKIEEASATDLVLRQPGSNDELPATSPIGIYVSEGTCSVTLDMVHLVRPQG